MTTTSQSLLARLRAIAPAATAADDVTSLRTSKLHTLDDAKKAAAKKLRANKAYLLQETGAKKPDLVYKQEANRLYAVGVKYGNRFLRGLFEDKLYAHEIKESELPAVLEELAKAAEEGEFDVQLQAAMDSNRSNRGKN